MGYIEAGSASKAAIEKRFLQAFPESAGKSTFAVFFSDVVRPFGSASVSRALLLTSDAAGRIQLDTAHADLTKAAIAKGLLLELNAVDRGVFPKTNRKAIDQILKQYNLTQSG